MSTPKVENMKQFEQWVQQFYEQRQWSQYDSFIRAGFMMEEVGELARAIRAIEIGRDRPDEEVMSYDDARQQLVEELGDVLANMLILSGKYDISLDEIMNGHVAKLTARFDT